MRLDKVLTDTGVATSRKNSKELLKKKQVRVNGLIVTDGKFHVDPTSMDVTVNGEKLTLEKYVYYMLNKPAGVVSATEDRHEQTVLDLLPVDSPHKKALFPVGRLDKDTTGLLLLTNDGALAHRLLAPKKHVSKWYRAQISGCMTMADQAAFAAGLTLGNGEVCLPAQLVLEVVDEERECSEVRIELKEGKYHQVKRMVAACGHHVTALHRLSMGSLTLDPQLKPGAFRRLTEQECQDLGITGGDQ